MSRQVRSPGRAEGTVGRARVAAIALGLAVLGWQGVNALSGRFVHEYLVADLVLAPLLIAAALLPGDRAAPPLLAGFAAFGGVFLAATTGKLLVGGAHPGTAMAALGLAACAAVAIGLVRVLSRRPPGGE